MNQSITLVFSGEAGQGIQTIEDFLMTVLSKDYFVFSCSDVMSRVRGGNNTTEIRISNGEVSAYKEAIDVLFLLNDHSLERLKSRIHKGTILVGREDYVDDAFLDAFGGTFLKYDFEKMAKEAGGKLFLNTVIFGFTTGMLNVDDGTCKELIEERFSSKGDKIVQDNFQAFDMGYKEGKDYDFSLSFSQVGRLDETMKVLNGTQAVGIGFLGGGCNAVCSYPMSPSTGVLIYLAGKSKDFGVLVEQAEDEIAALNMVLGIWYAGGRGLATTSGGGFSLMEEAMSLSGMTETPCVVHLAQRPGPATGLPTRTEQGDLLQAVFAGHGDYPKIILAPGTLRDGVELGQRAFYLADKYQVPVVVLTDQFYLESIGLMERFELDEKYTETFIIETKEDYLRYRLGEGPISERGIPGYGKGLVKVDSDEHDEEGTITEDFGVRVKMHEKRLAKKEEILKDYVLEELQGDMDYDQLVVGWGSTYGVVKECLETGNYPKTGFLSLKQLYPLRKDLVEYFRKAKNVVVVENNSNGQLAKLLQMELGIKVDHQVLQYDGAPFAVENLKARLEEVLR
ncbi:2-oxoacid:acceptor oxidoreductase subunit alpha [Alkalibacter rhizosphaerae]|uniref:2-oxoacid:acceptor oxidoreductase subunit alpha n=1 Tax=Alkalibacter rhizosphaerae TaxID=2815577 RepID=A0A975AIH0_9FIRM|nr:2-oxoacid:acceptor oxidoreductase subunit alpha [Alkalibacter rhizosphaerae]QSX09068.1 2-oxoacid:acceptor oxidoreductase subunit alpha [Alkalibacter rhizosphaerae]